MVPSILPRAKATIQKSMWGGSDFSIITTFVLVHPTSFLFHTSINSIIFIRTAEKNYRFGAQYCNIYTHLFHPSWCIFSFNTWTKSLIYLDLSFENKQARLMVTDDELPITFAKIKSPYWKKNSRNENDNANQIG